ncbi:MAG: hypothetical protein M0035_13085 [Actinomycetota bacterium]|nr:hypothetical protein [Actinomycetota bacterium]
MSLPGGDGLVRERWVARGGETYRSVLLDADADVGEWEEMVNSVERLARSIALSSVGILGSSELFDPRLFLGNAAGIRNANAERGRVAGPALLRIGAEARAGARVLVMAAGAVFDREDWDGVDADRWPRPSVETAWESTRASASAEAFLRGGVPIGTGLEVRADGWLQATFTSAAGPSSTGWTWGALGIETTEHPAAVELEVVRQGGSVSAPPEVLTAGWTMEVLGEATTLHWGGPQVLSTAEADALRSCLAGRRFRCPTCGGVEEPFEGRAISLRCRGTHQGRGFLFDSPAPWALPSLQEAAVAATPRLSWIALALRTDGGAELWTWPLAVLPIDKGIALVRKSPFHWSTLGELDQDHRPYEEVSDEILVWHGSSRGVVSSEVRVSDGGTESDDIVVLVARA